MTDLPDIDQPGSGNVYRVTEVIRGQRCMRQLGYDRHYSGVFQMNYPMLGGMAIDNTLTEHNEQKIQGKEGLRGTALVDYFVASLRQLVNLFTGRGQMIDVYPDPQVEIDGTRLLPIYEAEVDPHIDPIATQKTVSYTDPDTGVVLAGHVDLVRRAAGPEGHKIISDYKFTGKSEKQLNAETSQQMHSYDLCEGDGTGHVDLILLRRLKREPKVVCTSHFVTMNNHLLVKRAMKTVHDMFQANIWWPCPPDSWLCSPRWCSAWGLCRGRAQGPAPLPGEDGWEGK